MCISFEAKIIPLNKSLAVQAPSRICNQFNTTLADGRNCNPRVLMNSYDLHHIVKLT